MAFWSWLSCTWLTRRLAACTQAVVKLRSTSYIAIELNVLHLKSCEIQSNRCAQAILPLIAFLGIDYYSFADLQHVKWVKIVISTYKRFSLFSLAFVVVVVCFFSFLKQERHFEFQSYGGAWHRATLGSVNLFKIIRGISEVWKTHGFKN